MEFYKDRKFIFMALIFLLFLAGIVFAPTYSGMLLIVALLVFGSLCLLWKEPHIKLSGLGFLVVLAIINIALNGMHYGIDFSGGTRIPVVLEHSVDTNTMNELVQAIKKRVSVLGLTEVKVRSIGNSQVNVEIPSGDEERISFIEDVLAHQGVYMAVVDGKIALTGDHIYSTTIRATPSNQLSGDAEWGVSFSVDREGAEQFAATAKGKTDYPVYMFLDRPLDADLFYTRGQLLGSMLNDSSERESMNSLKDALELDDEEYPNATINVYVLDELDPSNLTIKPRTNKSIAIISENAPGEYKAALAGAGYTLEEIPESEMVPEFTRTGTGVLVVNKIEGAGLLSAPRLTSGVTTGTASYSYSISGGVSTSDPTEARKEAVEKQKSIESILKGGSLPVQISLGSRTTLPASLGEEFLKLSLIGIAAALVIISLFIGIRYMNITATLPIILISMAELVILLSILGSFTIDLAAMAGIIAAIGVGVDAQVVITDEILKKDKYLLHEKVEHAFSIIKTNVIVATLSMLPLLFSGLVEIIGFAISTILGSMLGYLLSRPAYAAIVEKIIGKEGGEHGAS